MMNVMNIVASLKFLWKCKVYPQIVVKKDNLYNHILQIHQYKIRRDEAFLTVDAYRKAFEEQLERSKALTVQLANLTTSTATKTSKARMALKWLMGTLNDDGREFGFY